MMKGKPMAGKAKMGMASYKKGGMVKGKGMHMMPDGSKMKDKDHAAMKKSGAAKK